jgi:DNA-binding IclR family transcriptional regulator
MPLAVTEVGIEDVLRRVRAEFLEMPGSGLTAEQVRRLLALDRSLCDVLLDALVHAEFLRLTPDGRYVRADS